MEAAGLAVGVVSLGLDLATRLQAYIEGVQGAAYRLNEITADVSATASIVRQLADLLEADKDALPQPQRKVDTPSIGSASDSDATVFGAPSPVAPASQRQQQHPVFSAKGIVEIEAVLRRCDQAYRVLVRVLVSATSESFSRTQKVLASAGLGDLTAARLARLTSRAKWPWLEPRIKACQKQLKSIKVDLLLSLHIASLARHRNSPRNGSGAEAEEDAALRSFAENLIAQRAKPSSEWSSEVPDAPSKASISQSSTFGYVPPAEPESAVASMLPPEADKGPGTYEPVFGSFMTAGPGFTPTSVALHAATEPPPPSLWDPTIRRNRGSPLLRTVSKESAEGPQTPKRSTSSRSKDPIDSPETSTIGGKPEADDLPVHPLEDLPGHGEDIPMGSLLYRHGQDVSKLRAWLLCRDDAHPSFFNLPVRDQALADVLRTCEQGPPFNALHQFLALSTEHKKAVLAVFDHSRCQEDGNKTLVAVCSRSRSPELPESVEVLVVISVDESRLEAVELEDIAGCTWPVPFYSLKMALIRARKESDLEAEVLRRCDGTAHRGSVRLFTEGPDSPSKLDYFFFDDDPFSPPAQTPVSFATLRDILRPKMRLRLGALQAQPPGASRPAPPVASGPTPKQFAPPQSTEPKPSGKTSVGVFGPETGEGYTAQATNRPRSHAYNTGTTRPQEVRHTQMMTTTATNRISADSRAPPITSASDEELYTRKGDSDPTADAKATSGARINDRPTPEKGDESGAESPPGFDMSKEHLTSRWESNNDVLKELFGDDVAGGETDSHALGVDGLLRRWTVREDEEPANGGV